MNRLLITGGEVVTEAATYTADVLIQEGLVVAIGRDLSPADAVVVDATGKLVLPGCVDMHTHLEAPHNELDDPSEGAVTCDGFPDGSIAAAVGGTTTIVDFATQSPGTSFQATLEQWKQRLRDRPPAVDVGFHMIVTDMAYPGAEDDLARMCDEGVTSYKLFLAYKESPLWVDDSTLFRVAQVAAKSGALVMAHAENGGAIEVLQEQALQRGDTAPIWHSYTRPVRTESEAISRVATLCGIAEAPAYIMHVSCREAAEVVAYERDRGSRLWAETCPHYLAFTEDKLLGDWSEAAKYLVTPPIRENGHADALWAALRDGTLSVVSTDHCPWLTRWKDAATDFFTIPNGVPGIENRLEVMYELGVRQGRLDLTRLVDLLCAAPARLFGMFPKKGTIAIGSSGDIVIFDPRREKVITADEEMSKCDYTIYEGFRMEGSVETVVFGGEIIVRDGRYVAQFERGGFLPRARFSEPS
ncbi:MAG TPA: dihydropyrimidinase [Gaiellaceae bacterium]|nr:dihydropyrimidinase [Gaiellaceae bacterium]